MKLRKIIVHCCFVAILTSCQTTELPIQQPVSLNESFALTKSERQTLAWRANNKHDADAAFQLYLYYGFSVSDVDREFVWLVKAAQLGNATAQYNLAYHFSEREDKKNLLEAGYWLNRAEKSAKYANDRNLIDMIHEIRTELANKLEHATN